MTTTTSLVVDSNGNQDEPVAQLSAENQRLKQHLHQVQADFLALEASAKLEKSHRERAEQQYELVRKSLRDLATNNNNVRSNPPSIVANGDDATESLEEYKERTNKQLEQLQAQNQIQSTLLQQMEVSLQHLQEESEKRIQELCRRLKDENSPMDSGSTPSLGGGGGVVAAVTPSKPPTPVVVAPPPPAISPSPSNGSTHNKTSTSEKTPPPQQQQQQQQQQPPNKEPKPHSFLENALRNRKQLIVSDPENSQGALLQRALQSKKSSSSSLSVPSPEPLSGGGGVGGGGGESTSQGLLKSFVMNKSPSTDNRMLTSLSSAPKLPVPAKPNVASQSSLLEAAIQKQQKQKKSGGFWDNILPMGGGGGGGAGPGSTTSPKPTIKKSNSNTAHPSTPAAAAAAAAAAASTPSTSTSISEKWRQHRELDASSTPQVNLHPERDALSSSSHHNSLSKWGLFQRATTSATTPTSQDSFSQLDDSTTSMLSSPMAVVVDKFFKKSPPSQQQQQQQQRMLREDKEFEAIMKMAADRTRGLSEEELNRILESGSPKTARGGSGEDSAEEDEDEDDLSESTGDDDDFVDCEEESESGDDDDAPSAASTSES